MVTFMPFYLLFLIIWRVSSHIEVDRICMYMVKLISMCIHVYILAMYVYVRNQDCLYMHKGTNARNIHVATKVLTS